MSRVNLGKKLSPATKVWKSFTSTVQKKLHKLKKYKPIKKTTKHLNTTLSTVFNRSRPLPSPFRVRLKKQSLIRPPSTVRIRHHNRHLRRSYAPVYVEELFMGPVIGQAKQPELQLTHQVGEKYKQSVAVDQPGSSKEGENVTKKVGEAKGSSSMVTEELKGIDERAEEFIRRFKQEMRLQRQKSFGEYQEMLARGD